MCSLSRPIHNMHARTSISTTTFSKAYLSVAWKNRDQLKEYERRGFAQFFYLTLCGHIEGVLAALIKARLQSVTHMVRWETLPPAEFNAYGKIQSCRLDPLIESLRRLLSSISDEAQSAPMAKLIELHGRIFPQKLSDILGPDLHQDLLALNSLRNLFAHGRDMFMEFDDPFVGKGTLAGNPLQLPAQRLLAAKIIKCLNITGQNHNEFQAQFFDDDALLYFYNAVQEIEKRLDASRTFLPESVVPSIPALPTITV